MSPGFGEDVESGPSFWGASWKGCAAGSLEPLGWSSGGLILKGRNETGVSVSQ